MPAYTDKAALVARYGTKKLVDLTDREQPYTETIVDAVLDQAIASAAAVIDAHLAGRYALPLASVPAVVAQIAGTLSIAGLYIDDAPAKVTADYQQAMKMLRDIRDGSLALDVAGVEPAAAQAGSIEVVAGERLFGRDNMAGF
ncbi:MAG TPA: DUF1320 domain-containing protein [Azospirillum sp.]|nr:DUF1320 domain-containing protein [Azospirillum sp.]